MQALAHASCLRCPGDHVCPDLTKGPSDKLGKAEQTTGDSWGLDYCHQFDKVSKEYGALSGSDCASVLKPAHPLSEAYPGDAFLASDEDGPSSNDRHTTNNGQIAVLIWGNSSEKRV